MIPPNPKKQPDKKWYDIKVECLVPCTLTYRILAEDEQEALKLITKQPHRHIQTFIPRKRNIKATVYDAGSCIVRFIKNFRA